MHRVEKTVAAAFSAQRFARYREIFETRVREKRASLARYKGFRGLGLPQCILPSGL